MIRRMFLNRHFCHEHNTDISRLLFPVENHNIQFHTKIKQRLPRSSQKRSNSACNLHIRPVHCVIRRQTQQHKNFRIQHRIQLLVPKRISTTITLYKHYTQFHRYCQAFFANSLIFYIYDNFICKICAIRTYTDADDRFHQTI